MLPSLKAFYHIGKTRTAFRQVRRIDLRDIAEAHDLGPRASACDERLHLFGREVLCLIDDDKLLQKCAAAHEAHGLHANAVLNEVHRGLTSPVTA